MLRYIGGRQEVDVSWMKEIEDPVGEDNSALSFSPPSFCLSPRRNLGRGISQRQSLLRTIGWKWITFSLLNGNRMTSS